MPDARVRELERQARSGDPLAASRLLQARLRAGDLSHEQLRVAAFLDHAPARAVSDAQGPVWGESLLLSELWDLVRLGPGAALQAVVAVARVGTHQFDPDSAYGVLCADLADLQEEGELQALLERIGLPGAPQGLVLRIARALLVDRSRPLLDESVEGWDLPPPARLDRGSQTLRDAVRTHVLAWALGRAQAA